MAIIQFEIGMKHIRDSVLAAVLAAVLTGFFLFLGGLHVDK